MRYVMSVFALVAVMALPAMAADFDDFQSYPLGSILTGQGGWEGWDGSSASAIVSNAHPKFPGDQAVMMFANDDVVHQYSGYTSGQCVFTAMQYIPRAHQGTVTYLILMNKYTLASKGWSVQLKFDYTTGMVVDDEAGGAGIPFVYDQWKQIKVVIDLDANTQSTFYDGVQVGTADWYDPGSADHLKSVAALDLWGDSGGTGVCYDDISLVVPEPATATLCLFALGGLLLRRR